MSFIREIRFTNFKQFERYVVSCKSTNILTGPNNAGKSSVLDALRIVADVIRFSARKKPQKRSLDGYGVCSYYEMPISAISIPISNISRNYADERAIVQVKTDADVSLVVRLHPDHPIEAYLATESTIPTTGVGFRKELDLDLCIVPTLGPFEEQEDFLTDATVEANRNTRRAARHFRNTVFRMGQPEFEAFSELVKSTWAGVTIKRPERNGQALDMWFEEERIPREIHWSGFGLQIWLQMLLQFMRGNDKSVFVLDEPDIYLHADLQRKLLRLC